MCVFGTCNIWHEEYLFRYQQVESQILSAVLGDFSIQLQLGWMRCINARRRESLCRQSIVVFDDYMSDKNVDSALTYTEGQHHQSVH